MSIAIIGGGIGGLSLANCFEQYKIPYILYEKATKFGEIGAGIGISESAFSILERIGLGSEIIQKGKFVTDAIIVNKKAQVVRKLPIKNGGFCIHRADLISILSKNISTEFVKFGFELDTFNTIDKKVILYFSNGQTLTHDYVFACDGINSAFRQRLFPTIKKRYSGQTIWRGIATCSLPAIYQTSYLEFWGENLRFATIPLNDEQYYWYACKPAIEGQQDDKETLKNELKLLFKNYCQEVNQAIDSTTLIIRNDMWDLKPHQESWHKSNIIFLGDAIHATTPNLAQGGCQAIEDAYTLATLVYNKGFSNEVFEEYRNLRIEKVNYIVNQSWNYGKISHQKNKFLEIVVQSIFRLLPKKIFEEQYRKLIDLTYLKK